MANFTIWTRMQAEAGQALHAIVARKELERQAGHGIFYWGVGSAPSRLIPGLAKTGVEVSILFSVMRSRPKPRDVAPASVLVWRAYIDPHGDERPLPPNVLITSRGGVGKSKHYALSCRSDEPLRLAQGVEFNPGRYRNAGQGGRPIGASQVTSLLEPAEVETTASPYEIAMSALATHGYWVRLTDPKELGGAAVTDLNLGSLGEPWELFAARLRK